MNQYLKSYQVVMRTVGPVFIGSGREIGKKEYMFLNRKLVGIPDIQRLYAELKKRKREGAFEEYLLGTGYMSLQQWLEKQRINVTDLDAVMKYKLECGDAVLDRGANRLQILECVKDPYGMPYIPGSSLKGMLRTILLAAELIQESGKYQGHKKTICQHVNERASRQAYLRRDIAAIEGTAFRTLNRPKTKPQDAVNDILQGFVISDSESLSTDDLVLCQKIDIHTDKREKPLPILRECIKPNTEIRFTITMDTSICNLSEQKLREAIKIFMNSYRDHFVSAFRGMDMPKEDEVLCGGGCGFVSKTMIYPLYGKKEGIELVKRIFENTRVPRNHKHDRDAEYGAAPHTIKCTRYHGKLYQMGVCRVEEIWAV